MSTTITRRAAHAGAWYSSNPGELQRELSRHLENAETVDALPGFVSRAIICPAATAAYSYKHLHLRGVKRIFMLGPSHHAYIDGAALPEATVYETPLGDLQVDVGLVSRLRDSGKFQVFKRVPDEEEHSLEMQLPFVRLLIKENSVELPIVPIIIGSISAKKQQLFGEILAPFLADRENFFIISSDFCHWGTRFQYTFVNQEWGPEIYKSIEKLDHLGMQAIESLNPDMFEKYLKQTNNTICGRHPIAVLMNMVSALPNKRAFLMKEAHYSQSSKCVSQRDSSVSYGAMVLFERVE
eukprot:ANDGO_02485.mRNA.1 Protein MEMO1 homolog